MKLACIGASYKFVKNLVNDLILTGSFEDTRVAVMDVDPTALEAVVGACRAVAAAGHSRIEIVGTLDRAEVLDGADFVLTAIGVGGLGLWQEEARICEQYGIVHAIGDTIGPGALSKSLRTVPVMLGIARDMEQRCPDAWLLNVTNPMATTVKAVAEHTDVKVVGLCHGSQEMRDLIAKVYGVEPSEVAFDVVGVNHFAFANRISVRGRDVTKTLVEDAAGSGSPTLDCWRLGRELFGLLGGWLPLVEDRHLAEFFPWYVTARDGNRIRYGDGPLDVAKRARARAKAEQIHRDLASGAAVAEKPGAYSGEDIHGILASLHHGREGRHVVNVPNRGYCPDLRDGAVLEIPVLATKGRISGICIEAGTLDPHLVSLLDAMSVICDYTVQAAVTGDLGWARKALLLDPFLQNRDLLAIIPRLVEDIARINARYLADGGTRSHA